jgi:hypothetical protein
MSIKIPEGLGYCGLNCYTCPINKATRMVDKFEQFKVRTEIARMCREEYGMTYNVEDITDCYGCTNDNDILFPGCRTCKIRNCARDRGYASCVICPEYTCDILEEFYIKDSTARANLQEIRNKFQ